MLNGWRIPSDGGDIFEVVAVTTMMMMWPSHSSYLSAFFVKCVYSVVVQYACYIQYGIQKLEEDSFF